MFVIIASLRSGQMGPGTRAILIGGGCDGTGKGLDNYVDINIIKSCQKLDDLPFEVTIKVRDTCLCLHDSAGGAGGGAAFR